MSSTASIPTQGEKRAISIASCPIRELGTSSTMPSAILNTPTVANTGIARQIAQPSAPEGMPIMRQRIAVTIAAHRIDHHSAELRSRSGMISLASRLLGGCGIPGIPETQYSTPPQLLLQPLIHHPRIGLPPALGDKCRPTPPLPAQLFLEALVHHAGVGLPL